MVIVPSGGVRRENCEKLEFDDFLYGITMYSRPQASQHDLTFVLKRPERSKESREDANREQRGEQNWQESVQGALWAEI